MLGGLPSTLASPLYSWDLQTDYSYAPTKLAEASITAGKVSRINEVDAAYSISPKTPNGNGLSASQMQEIDDIINITYSMVRDPGTGVLTGRALVVIDDEDSSSVSDLGQPASFNGDWIPDVRTIIDYYTKASPAQEATLEQAYLDMIELLLNYNPFPGWSGADLDAGNGYTWRNTAWKTLQMCHTLPTEERNLFALSMFFISGGQRLLIESHDTGLNSSTDDYHTTYKTAFNALSLMDDNAFKWQLFNAIRLQLDKSIVGSPENGQYGLISIDGGIIHHTGHHFSYGGYSFGNMAKPHIVMSEAGFNSTMTAQAVDRFRKAAIAWSWASTDGYFSVHFLLRPSHPSSAGSQTDYYVIGHLENAAEVTAAYRYGDRSQIGGDLELAHPAIIYAGAGSSSLPNAWRSISLPESSAEPVDNYTNLMQGHHSFQVMGAAIQRRDDWQVSVRGAHTYRRGGEGYEAMGGVTHHHEMNMRGSMLLITEGKNGRRPNSADSGYFYEGWDHNFYPNVTTPIRAMEDHLYWRRPGYFNGAATLTGGANLFDNGVWFYVPTDGSQRKSAFFFDNRITLVTSDINYASDPRGIITGLIQQGAPNFASYPIKLNGATHSGTGQWSLAAGGNHKIVDINGNGYYIHAGAPAIEAVRGVQSWTYGLSSYYTGPGSMPSYTLKEDFTDDVDAGYFNPTTANSSRVYFDHGTSAANESLAYTVLVKPSGGELDTLANNMNTPGSEPFTLDTTNDRHVLYDVATDTYAATLFTDGQTINQGGLISASRAGAYMWRKEGQEIHISCGSSEMSDSSAFELVLSGEWSVTESYDTLSSTVRVTGSNTTVTLPYRQFAKQGIVLTQVVINMAPTFESDPVVESSATEGGAYSGSLADNASDDDSDPLSFSKVSGPTWLTVATNGNLSGTPAAGDVDLNAWTVAVTDGMDTNSAILQITVDAAPVGGGTGAFNPVDDTFSKQHDPTVSFGGDSTLNLRLSATKQMDGYLKFDVQGVSGSITNAKLKVFTLHDHTMSVHTVANTSWDENTLNYNNRESIGAQLDSQAATADSWVTFDLPPGTVSGNGLISLGLKTTSASFRNISTKEDGVNIPVLEVSYTGAVLSNNAPTFDSDPVIEVNATKDSAYNASLSDEAIDTDGDPMIFAKVSGPSWLAVAGNGVLSGTPLRADVGINNWSVQVTDGNATNTTTLQVTVLSDGDWDDDGIPDSWELQYFGHETNATASGHGDDDDFDNLSEYISGFNPTNGLSYPVITGLEVSADGSELIISWPAEATGRAYDVMSANRLAGIFSNRVGSCVYPQNSYTNAVDPGAPAAFYRICFKLQESP